MNAPSSAARATVWLLCGTAFFSLVFAGPKFVPAAPVILLVWVRALTGFAIALGLYYARGGHAFPRLNSLPPMLARVALGFSGGYCLMKAGTLIPLAEATTIGLLEGGLMVILGGLFLGEKAGPLQWLAVAVAFVGGFIAVTGGKLNVAAFGEGALLAFLGALLLAAEALFLRRIAQSERPSVALIYTNLLGFLALTPFAIPFVDALTPLVLVVGVLIGVLALSGQYCNMHGFAGAPLFVVGTVGYSWIIFAALIGYFAFGEPITATLVLGAGLIFAAGVLLLRT